MTPLLSNTTRRLVWEPGRAEVALGGDLGYTIGDYRVEATASPDSVLSRGKYLTVWRRQPDGSWKVEADIGSPAP
jgi:ketosteroid isomerase-like protein